MGRRGCDDGYLYGRGAIDMKNQTAAEAVAAAPLARGGALRFRGTLKVIAVADEETGGGTLGAKWITAEPAGPARGVDFLLNEGGGRGHALRRPAALYGVCVAEKGTFRFNVDTIGTAAHASVPAARRQRAAQARAGDRAAGRQPSRATT